jgi:hypothetical protein
LNEFTPRHEYHSSRFKFDREPSSGAGLITEYGWLGHLTRIKAVSMTPGVVVDQ